MRGLEILQYLFFLVELIFVSSSYSVCFPKHLICHKNLIYHVLLQFEKCTPLNTKTDSFGHFKLKGVSALFFHFPSHIASDFVGLILSPEHLSNFFQKLQQYVRQFLVPQKNRCVIRILRYFYFTGTHCDAFDFRILYYCKC